MSIYVKTSNGASLLDHSYKLVKTAMYNCNDDWTVAKSNDCTEGTAWHNQIWDDIGLTYVKDTSTYQNYFICPSSGILLVHCALLCNDRGPSSSTMIAVKLLRNDITQYTLYGRLQQYRSTSFLYFQKVSKGDKLKLLAAQNSADYLTVNGQMSRLCFIMFS